MSTIKCHKRDSGKPAKVKRYCRRKSCQKLIKGPNMFFCPKCHEMVDREPWDDETYSGFSAHASLRAMGVY